MPPAPPAAPAPPVLGPGPRNAITDVAGVRVGHHHRRSRGWLTGATVVLPPPGTVAGVDVRGGGPGTRETDALDPANLVPHVHGVCLAGGSAYGLAAADGVVTWLGRHQIGYPVGEDPHQVVPIVPGAVLFDLGRGGRFDATPTPEFGLRAAAGARAAAVAQGVVGAGSGAVAGGLKGGIGTASAVLATGVTVGAVVALNAAGRVFDPATGLLPGAALGLPGEFRGLRRPSRGELAAALATLVPVRPLNTTIGVVATDARLTKPECARLAMAAHDGLARAVRPAHGMTDGDTFFSLATGARPVTGDDEDEAVLRYGSPEGRTPRINEVLLAAADCVSRAIAHAVLAATTVVTASARFPSYHDVFPTAVGPAFVAAYGPAATRR